MKTPIELHVEAMKRQHASFAGSGIKKLKVLDMPDAEFKAFIERYGHKLTEQQIADIKKARQDWQQAEHRIDATGQVPVKVPHPDKSPAIDSNSIYAARRARSK